MINLANLQENKVSTDLSGYPVVFLGETGDGKTNSMFNYLTSVAPEGKVPLFIEFEDRYKAIPGIMAARVYSISDVMSILAQLQNPQIREKFSGIVIDTIDKFEEMASTYNAKNKEVAIIEDLNFGKGKRYLNATLGIITEIRNLGLPVHVCVQSYKNTDIITKKTTVVTKLKDITEAKIFHDAFLVGMLKIDNKAKDPMHSDRLITFRKDDINIKLKDTFGLPKEMHVKDIKTNLEKLFDKQFDKSQLRDDAVLEEIKEEVPFSEIIEKGNELGALLANEGHLEEAMNVLKTNIGQDDQGNPKMFDSLLETQIDLAKVVVLKLEDIVNKYNLK